MFENLIRNIEKWYNDDNKQYLQTILFFISITAFNITTKFKYNNLSTLIISQLLSLTYLGMGLNNLWKVVTKDISMTPEYEKIFKYKFLVLGALFIELLWCTYLIIIKSFKNRGYSAISTCLISMVISTVNFTFFDYNSLTAIFYIINVDIIAVNMGVFKDIVSPYITVSISGGSFIIAAFIILKENLKKNFYDKQK